MNGIESHLKEVWWLLLLRGIALVLFGLVAVVWPGLTLLALATLLAVYFVIAGVVDIVSGVRAEGRRSMWFLTIILGLLEIGLGVYLLKSGLALATFIALIGIALMIYGILEIVGAFEPGEDSGRRFLLVLGGAISLIAGFIVLRYPASSGLAFVWILGVWGLVLGALQIAMCLSLKSKMNEVDRRAAHGA
jgi:uncharacterized membrane protein HdeD (DUF308 family)